MEKTISLVLVLVLVLSTVSPATEDTWTFKNPIPTGRGFTSGAVLDGKIYVIGGFLSHTSITTANEMYDPATDQWTVMEPMPQARCGHATCTCNGKIYVLGGLHPNAYAYAKNNIYEYDPQTDTWTQKANMPYRIAAPGIAVLNDTIYLIGGTTNYYTPPIKTVMAYEPVTETWSEKAPLLSPRALVEACVVDGKIYIIGGGDENLHDYAFDYVEVYEPATNTWTAKTDMPTSRMALGICAMDGKVFAVGGLSHNLVVITKNEMYDPVTDTWTKKSPIQEKRHSFFFGSIGDKIYAIGGSYPINNEPMIPTSVVEYDPAADKVGVSSVQVYTAINPTSFMLYQNFPNPFNPFTMINYQLPVTSEVELSIYNLMGQKMTTLVSEKQLAGIHNVEWDGSGFISGVYYYRIKTGQGFMQTKKLVLLK